MNSTLLKKCIAEFIGTLFLALGVSSALRLGVADAAPLVASLTLALFVYTVGPISGAHFNPAVTVGLLTIQRIKNQEAVWYIAAQLLGALAAIVLGSLLVGGQIALDVGSTMKVGLAEVVGTFVLIFGISAVVHRKVTSGISGVLIGGSLFLGILLASFSGSAGMLNPAVAIASNSASLMYILGPIVGGVLGAQLGKYLHS